MILDNKKTNQKIHKQTKTKKLPAWIYDTMLGDSKNISRYDYLRRMKLVDIKFNIFHG
jgi:hypothetical protein